MQQIFSTKKTAMAIAIGLALTLGACGGDDEPGTPSGLTTTQNAWMTSAIIAEMDAAKAKDDAAWEAVANKRAKLLIAFLERPNQILSREQLLSGRDVSALDRSIDLRVSRLRKRFEQGGHSGKFIKTVYGAGYLLAATVSWS